MLKNHFIPHKGNDYQPLFLRFKIALALLVMVLLLEGVYLLGTLVILPKSKNFAAIFAAVLVEQTNKERATGELRTLRPNTQLEAAAKLKAEDMAAKGYFSHNTPDGKTPWHWFKLAGYEYAAAGENLAVNFTDSKDVTEAWMRSPTHRANIMSGNYTEIGIATAEGTYKGRAAIFVVQTFGRPSIVARQTEVSTSTRSALSNAITGTVAGVSDAPPQKVVTIKPIPAKPKEKLVVEKSALVSATPEVVRETSVVAPSTPTTTVVAGEGTTQLDIPDESLQSFTQTVNEPKVVVGEKPSKLEILVASPRQTTTVIFLFIAATLALALGLAVFIKVRVQHPHIIANGVLLLAIVCAIVLLNFALVFTRGVI